MITHKINGRRVTNRQLRDWGKRRREVFGVVPPWESGGAPNIRTNDTFMRGKKQGVTDEDFSPGDLARYKRLAAKKGVSTTGKFYFSQLADEPGDPEAWCAGDGDVLATAKRKKMAVTLNGRVYDYRDKYAQQEPQPYKVADSIVEAHAEDLIDEQYGGPRATKKQREEAYQKIREQLTPDYV